MAKIRTEKTIVADCIETDRPATRFLKVLTVVNISLKPTASPTASVGRVVLRSRKRAQNGCFASFGIWFLEGYV